jgi:anti-sigma regulatory factor (Ser/Thr protein kinase)
MASSTGQVQPEEFRLVLSPDIRAGWRTRQALRQRFSRSLPHPTLIDLIAVVTELVNNAVAHGPGRPITVTLVTADDVITGEIADQGNPASAIPRIRDRTETDRSETGGGGLELVDRLTSRWAVYEGSTHVWFELRVDA